MHISGHSADKVFASSIPEIYDTCLVPLIFESYAADLARRLAARSPSRVLEVAAGPGVLTRALATALRQPLTSSPPISTSPCSTVHLRSEQAARICASPTTFPGNSGGDPDRLQLAAPRRWISADAYQF